jgi:phage terminase large subunit-like protein
MSKQKQIELIRALEAQLEVEQRKRLPRMVESFYDWQDRFVESTKEYVACALIAANQVGKTRTGTAIDAVHLSGDYPLDWKGHRFFHAPRCWLLGYSGEKTRDLLQVKLFGELDTTTGRFTGGLIPATRIAEFKNGRHKYKAMTGTSGACREVRVKHASGKESICQFWSYSQGQHALMGDVVDWYHIDEEPEDQEIFPQVLTRTLNGDRGTGGRGILTLTPENGKTDLVCTFMDEPSPDRYIQTATWDDAYHLDDATKEAILSTYPEYQRDMRSRGIPLMGSGLIFEHGEEALKADRFQIPDHFFLIDGMDFGWDHPQAHVQLAIDPDSGVIYVTQAWKAKKNQPYEAWECVKAWAKDVPTAWPHDGLQHEKGSAKQQKDYYEEAGFNMLHEHAQWKDGGNGVEAGLMELNKLMKTDKFKVFSDLKIVFEELREYHRKSLPDGRSKIVKVKDDLIDAIRYAYMMARYAQQKYEIGYVPEEWEDDNLSVGVMGY